MVKAKHLVLIFGILTLNITFITAQNRGTGGVPSNQKTGEIFPSDANNLTKKGLIQEEEYSKLSYGFPGKPRSKWAVGLKLGANLFHGDVENSTRFGLGVDISKSLGHAVAVRSSIVVGQIGGQNKEANTVLPGSVESIAGYGNTTVWNFKTNYQYMALQMIININNINFYDEEPNLKIHGFIGPAFMNFTQYTNLKDDSDGLYDYSQGMDNVSLDNSYETLMDVDSSKFADVRPVPILTVGFGFSYRITKRWEVGMEYTYHNEMLYKSDLWDGRRFQETVGVLSTDYDGFSTINITTVFNFGKGVSPLGWVNPLEVEYEEVRELKKQLKELLVDSDKDGIADPFDKEPETPEGARVSPDGVTLDSDNDGTPDYLDPEPYSQFNNYVDSTGATPVNDQGIPLNLVEYMESRLKECCEKKSYNYQGGNGLEQILQATKDPSNVPKDTAKFWNVVPTAPVQVKVMGLWALPTIHFDLDKDLIKPEMYDELLFVATAMKNNPQIVVSVNGHTDIRHSNKYNENLGRRRAKRAIDHLIKFYDIAPDRLRINSFGEIKNLIPDAASEIEHYMNRRVEFYATQPD